MREIKFRVWCEDHQEWEKHPILLGSHGEIYHWHHNQPMIIRPDRHVIEYCVGVIDKNGKDVYEGDLVRIGEKISEVMWQDGGFCVDIGDKTVGAYVPFLGEFTPDQYEVVGNIHESPRLLLQKEIQFANDWRELYIKEKERLDWILSDNEPYFIDDRNGINHYIQDRKELDKAISLLK